MYRPAVLVAGMLAIAAVGFQTSSASAGHSWGNYHWERGSTATPIVFVLGDNLTNANWDITPPLASGTYLKQASDDWSVAAAIDTSVDSSISPDPANCEVKRNFSGPIDKTIHVCSKQYGSFNGWLGLAQIWIIDGHIIKGVAKLNDSYFNTSTYNTPEWRDLVMCQEVGHVFGLGHQDENFSNGDLVSGNPSLQTCMDYTNVPEDNGQPNQHDYDQLALIYNHNDAAETADNGSGPGNGKGGGPNKGKGSGLGKLVAVSGFEFATYVRNDPSEWGTAVAFTSKGQPRVFVKDLGNGVKVVTHVTWTEDARAGAHFPHQH